MIRLLSVVEILIKHSSLHDKTAYPVLSRVLQMSAQSFDTTSIFSFILISVEKIKQQLKQVNYQNKFTEAIRVSSFNWSPKRAIHDFKESREFQHANSHVSGSTPILK